MNTLKIIHVIYDLIHFQLQIFVRLLCILKFICKHIRENMQQHMLELVNTHKYEFLKIIHQCTTRARQLNLRGTLLLVYQKLTSTKIHFYMPTEL